MVTLVNIFTGASLCGQKQKTLNHLLFPEISGVREMEWEGNPKRDF